MHDHDDARGNRNRTTSEPTLWWTRILGVLCLTAAGAHAQMFSLISLQAVRAGEFGSVLALALAVLFTTSAVGLLLGRGWGFFCFYALVAVATVFATLSLVPFLTDMVPQPWRGWTVLACNLLVLWFAFRLHRARAALQRMNGRG